MRNKVMHGRCRQLQTWIHELKRFSPLMSDVSGSGTGRLITKFWSKAGSKFRYCTECSCSSGPQTESVTLRCADHSGLQWVAKSC